MRLPFPAPLPAPHGSDAPPLGSQQVIAHDTLKTRLNRRLRSRSGSQGNGNYTGEGGSNFGVVDGTFFRRLSLDPDMQVVAWAFSMYEAKVELIAQQHEFLSELCPVGAGGEPALRHTWDGEKPAPHTQPPHL